MNYFSEKTVLNLAAGIQFKDVDTTAGMVVDTTIFQG